jgi:hypothetical protein
MIVFEHLSEEVEGLFRHQMLILAVHKLVPWFFSMLAKDIVVVAVKSSIVLINVCQ